MASRIDLCWLKNGCGKITKTLLYGKYCEFVLEEIVLRYGWIKISISYRGPQFASAFLQKLLMALNKKHRETVAYCVSRTVWPSARIKILEEFLVNFSFGKLYDLDKYVLKTSL